jgi:hypothetical protein
MNNTCRPGRDTREQHIDTLIGLQSPHSSAQRRLRWWSIQAFPAFQLADFVNPPRRPPAISSGFSLLASFQPIPCQAAMCTAPAMLRSALAMFVDSFLCRRRSRRLFDRRDFDGVGFSHRRLRIRNRNVVGTRLAIWQDRIFIGRSVCLHGGQLFPCSDTRRSLLMRSWGRAWVRSSAT